MSIVDQEYWHIIGELRIGDRQFGSVVVVEVNSRIKKMNFWIDT